MFFGGGVAFGAGAIISWKCTQEFYREHINWLTTRHKNEKEQMKEDHTRAKETLLSNIGRDLMKVLRQNKIPVDTAPAPATNGTKLTHEAQLQKGLSNGLHEAGLNNQSGFKQFARSTSYAPPHSDR